MTYRIVQRLRDAAEPEDLFQGQGQNRTTKLDDFTPYLCTSDGPSAAHDAWALWEEITTHGCTGGSRAVRALPPAVSHIPDRADGPCAVPTRR